VNTVILRYCASWRRSYRLLSGGACAGPALPHLLARYSKAGGTYVVCPICFDAKQLDKGRLIAGAELAGSVQLWEWIGDEGATTFSY
jgi:hypothetical protein